MLPACRDCDGLDAAIERGRYGRSSSSALCGVCETVGLRLGCAMHMRGRSIAVFCVATLFASPAYAGRPVSHDSAQADTREVLVFVTGSHIPQRVKLYRVGT